MSYARQSRASLGAIEFGTLRGSQAPRDELRAAKPRFAQAIRVRRHVSGDRCQALGAVPPARSTVVRTASFRFMFVRCVSTVLTLMQSRRATSLLEQPETTRRKISISRRES